MAIRPLPSLEVLRQLFRHEPETGKLFWKERPVSMFTSGKYSAARNAAIWNTRFAGKEAFTASLSNGYLHGTIFGCQHRTHRIMWALFYGYEPNGHIDHINGDKADNRISNLREATASENRCNVGLRADNTSGYKGVHWFKTRRKWRAEIRLCGKRRGLGYFDTSVEAAMAYDEAARQLHGDFARLNFP
ncbi:MAG: HNH endonuclease [Paracoccus sp. (in: a-proteobacteria)]|uniref:HNH endonuclease n=1 Tax=Paracoccus sp. TaxID=267 RepID=UPI0032D9872A